MFDILVILLALLDAILIFGCAYIYLIFKQLKTISMKQSELATEIANVTATVGKIKTEVTTTLEKVTELETALANAGEVTPEVQNAFDALKASVTTVDGLIPDAPTEEPTV